MQRLKVKVFFFLPRHPLHICGSAYPQKWALHLLLADAVCCFTARFEFLLAVSVQHRLNVYRCGF